MPVEVVLSFLSSNALKGVLSQ